MTYCREEERAKYGAGAVHNIGWAGMARRTVAHKVPVEHRRTAGAGLTCVWPVELTDTRPQALLSAVGIDPPGDDVAAAESLLIERINAHANSLPLPAAAVVAEQAEAADDRCEDLLTILAILSKSSGKVYLRDKRPVLSHVRPGRRAVLIVPNHWRQHHD
ncbi:MAG: hypothetical protein IT368_15180 [Candidatus Hydrogenedentes bacterium]|nr:hypothetical protein [Candidatus Hydrogenedentota bacterium]